MAKRRVLKNLNTRSLKERLLEHVQKERKHPKSAKATHWLDIRNKTETSADLYIYDEISWFGVLAMDVVEELQALDVETLNVRINSPGGLVFEGMAIYNLLRDHKAKVTVFIDGLAASIASVIAMAGDEIVMAENALMMIHDPSTIVWGDAEDLRREADLLDKIKETIVRTYQTRSHYDEAEIRELMAEETWFDAGEAIEAGLADRSTAAKKVAACARPQCEDYRRVPEGFEWAKEEEPKRAQRAQRARLTPEEVRKLKAFLNSTEDETDETDETDGADGTNGSDGSDGAAARARARARERELNLKALEA